jgi:hypothetical protein
VHLRSKNFYRQKACIILVIGHITGHKSSWKLF